MPQDLPQCLANTRQVHQRTVEDYTTYRSDVGVVYLIDFGLATKTESEMELISKSISGS